MKLNLLFLSHEISRNTNFNIPCCTNLSWFLYPVVGPFFNLAFHSKSRLFFRLQKIIFCTFLAVENKVLKFPSIFSAAFSPRPNILSRKRALAKFCKYCIMYFFPPKYSGDQNVDLPLPRFICRSHLQQNPSRHWLWLSFFLSVPEFHPENNQWKFN